MSETEVASVYLGLHIDTKELMAQLDSASQFVNKKMCSVFSDMIDNSTNILNSSFNEAMQKYKSLQMRCLNSLKHN